MTSRKSLTLRILSPEGTILEVDEASSINVPLADGGGIGIRPGHAALIAETVEGSVHYLTSAGKNQIQISAGILSISENVVTILTIYEIQESSEIIKDEEITELIQSISQELTPVEQTPLDKVA